MQNRDLTPGETCIVMAQIVAIEALPGVENAHSKILTLDFFNDDFEVCSIDSQTRLKVDAIDSGLILRPGMTLIFDLQKRMSGDYLYAAAFPLDYHNRIYSYDFCKAYFTTGVFKNIMPFTFENKFWPACGGKILYYMSNHPEFLPSSHRAMIENVLEDDDDDGNYAAHNFKYAIRSLLSENYDIKPGTLGALAKLLSETIDTVTGLMDRIKNSPWELFDKYHDDHPVLISFSLIDDMALNAGWSRTDPIRLEYAIGSAIRTVLNEGSHAYTREQLEVRKLSPWVGGGTHVCVDMLISGVDYRSEWLFQVMPKIREFVGIGISDDIIYDALFNKPSRFLSIQYINGYRYVYHRKLLDAELKCAEILAEMAGDKINLPVASKDVPDYMTKFEAMFKKFSPSEGQLQAFRNALTNRVSVITGGPGCGKTTVSSFMIKMLQVITRKPPFVVAATGKAVKQIASEVRSNVPDAVYESSTIASLKVHSDLALKLDTSFDGIGEIKYSADYFAGRVMIVDEASMASLSDFTTIVQLIRDGFLIIVGDIQQLPPIASGQVFRDLFNFDGLNPGKIAVTKLQSNYRVGSSLAPLIDCFNLIRQATDENKPVFIDQFDFSTPAFMADFKKVDGMMAELIVDNYVDNVQKYGADEVICIAPVHKGYGGDWYLNYRLQDARNPKPARKKKPKRDGNIVTVEQEGVEIKSLTATVCEDPSYNKSGGKIKRIPIRIGDRVIITCKMLLESGKRPDGTPIMTSVVNGDCGKVLEHVMDLRDDDVEYVSIQLDSGITVKLDKDGFDSLDLAYAMTVHKAQGSGYACVMVVYDNRLAYCDLFNSRNMFYTGITRTKQVCHLYGAQYVFQQALDCVLPNRKSLLPYRIAQAMS